MFFFGGKLVLTLIDTEVSPLIRNSRSLRQRDANDRCRFLNAADTQSPHWGICVGLRRARPTRSAHESQPSCKLPAPMAGLSQSWAFWRSVAFTVLRWDASDNCRLGHLLSTAAGLTPPSL